MTIDIPNRNLVRRCALGTIFRRLALGLALGWLFFCAGSAGVQVGLVALSLCWVLKGFKMTTYWYR